MHFVVFPRNYGYGWFFYCWTGHWYSRFPAVIRRG